VSDQPFLADVRAALRVEMATVRVGVAAPQIRGRIAARKRDRRRTRLRAATALATAVAVMAALPVVAGLVLPAALGPPPGGVQPASVATIDAESGELTLMWAWSDGRLQPGLRYPGVLEVLRDVSGDPAIDRLPEGTVATAGPDGRLAIALPGGDILVARAPSGRLFPTRVVVGEVEVTWLGWANDGRLVAIGRPFAAPDARLRLRVVDPETGTATVGALQYGIVPRPTIPRSSGAIVSWTDRGTILAERRDPRTGATTIGSLDISRDPVSFDPSLPRRVQVTTGLEPELARDESAPQGWSPDGEAGWSSVGAGAGADIDRPAVGWYVAPTDERVFDVVRSADLLRLVAVVAREDGSSARVVVVDWPGSWRDAVNLTGEAAVPVPDRGSAPTGDPTVHGVAPDGRSIAVGVGGLLVVADLATGASTRLPPGTVFVGWPEPTVAVTEAVPTAPACVVPSTATASSITLAAAGLPASADNGVRPLIGDPSDADPWQRDRCESASRVAAIARGRLVVALPQGTCVDAFRADAVLVGSAPGAAPVALAGRSADWPASAGLLEMVAPPAGEWVVRLALRLRGAGEESILLYRVGAADHLANPARDLGRDVGVSDLAPPSGNRPAGPGPPRRECVPLYSASGPVGL
jgi:hypothetical protein